MRSFRAENLCHDPIHGYIAFTSGQDFPPGETAERQIIDHPWLQRLRQIHQLQTARWVFPSAEHTRFQHVLGVMHLASRAIASLYSSLAEVCPDVPSQGYVEALMRTAGLLHDVGHGPFGHFFDEHYLRDYGLTHEKLGSVIICNELGDMLRGIRRTPNAKLAPHEMLDPRQVAFLITRPRSGEANQTAPRWLALLRSLFCGLYTVDNMDFVLRDAYMSGYSVQAFDLDRLLHYSFFSPQGLTIHAKGLPALVRFMGARDELFRTVYFHRTVRAIDLALADLFAASKHLLFPGNPLEHLDEYQHFTEFSLLVDVQRWTKSADPERQQLGQRWRQVVDRQSPWHAAVERRLVFTDISAESRDIFSDADTVDKRLRAELPANLKSLELRIDLARHIHRPYTRGPSGNQNFIYDPARNLIQPLDSDQLYRQLPVVHRLCRIYVRDDQHAPQIAAALDHLLGSSGHDDLTNM